MRIRNNNPIGSALALAAPRKVEDTPHSQGCSRPRSLMPEQLPWNQPGKTPRRGLWEGPRGPCQRLLGQGRAWPGLGELQLWALFPSSCPAQGGGGAASELGLKGTLGSFLGINAQTRAHTAAFGILVFPLYLLQLSTSSDTCH